MKVHITATPEFPLKTVKEVVDILNQTKGYLEFVYAEPFSIEQICLYNAKFETPKKIKNLTFDEFFHLCHCFRVSNNLPKEDYIVIVTVARRMPTGRLFRLIRDKDAEVRKVVAERLPEVSLGLMTHDDAPEVRRIIAERMSPEDAVALLTDPDWVVRYTVVQRVAPEALINLLDDPEPDVRAAVQERLISHANQAHGNKKPEA